MRVLMIPIGSAGDVHPFVGMGVELRRRGSEVHVLTSPYFEPLVRACDLGFSPLGTLEEFQSVLTHPDLWDARKGFELVARHSFGPAVRPAYEFVREHLVPGETVVVSSTLALGARVAQETHGVPVVSVNLQPVIYRSVHDTPFYGEMPFVQRLPAFLKRAVFRLVDIPVDRIATKELNALRRELGLPPVRRLLNGWMFSPDRDLACFPEWFAAPQPDWPPQTRLVGFPRYDAGNVHPMSEALTSFLAAGEPPVVFTAGSAMRQAPWFFDEAVRLCERLGVRGVLVNRFSEQIPARLPPTMFHADYAPFGDLFPRCAVIVHHGGIGTTAQALFAGAPQLIMPMAHDQPDNARRIERLGVGMWVSVTGFRAGLALHPLKRLLADPAVGERSRSLAKAHATDPSGIAAACDWIQRAGLRRADSATLTSATLEP